MKGSKTGIPEFKTILIKERAYHEGYYIQIIDGSDKKIHITAKSFIILKDKFYCHPITEKLCRINYNLKNHKININIKRQEVLIYKK